LLHTYSLRPIKIAILDFEKIPQRMQYYRIDLTTFLIKWSNLTCKTKLTAFGKYTRVLESFHFSTLKLHSFMGRAEVSARWLCTPSILSMLKRLRNFREFQDISF
jgi:hypothetical protein